MTIIIIIIIIKIIIIIIIIIIMARNHRGTVSGPRANPDLSPPPPPYDGHLK